MSLKTLIIFLVILLTILKNLCIIYLYELKILYFCYLEVLFFMNKKFLSVALSASMIFSSMGGHYCFAENNTQFSKCSIQLQKCSDESNQLKNELSKYMSKDEIKNLELAFSKNLPKKTNSSDLMNTCYDQLKKCRLQKVNYEIELDKFPESTSKWLFGWLRSFFNIFGYAAGTIFIIALFC